MSDTEIQYTIKAVGERTLEIRVAYGRDAHGEQFTVSTDFDIEHFPAPPVAYYHGYGADGKPAKRPIYIGKTVSRASKADGHYLTARLGSGPEADAVWAAAIAGHAAASPGTAAHLIRRERDGTLSYWPIVEISAWDNADGARKQAHPYSVARPVLKALGLDIETPTEATPEAGDGGDAAGHGAQQTTMENTMTPDEVQAAIKSALAEQAAGVAAEAARKQEINAAAAEAVKAARAEWEASAAPARRLPEYAGKAPHVAQFAHLKRFDHLTLEDQAFLISTVGSVRGQRASDAAYQAFAVKAAEGKAGTAHEVQAAIKAAGIDPAQFLAAKANELDYSTQAGFGDEWVSISWNSQVWNVARDPSRIASLLPTIEIPQGSESIYDPLEGADPTFYKVAETTGSNATTLIPDATVTSSKLATGRVLHTATKIGGRVMYSGEMSEDSIVPFVAQLREQLAVAAAEALEDAIINGDTDATASTNINDIGGTPGSTDVFLVFNGFRKSPLVTTTANSRSASGAFVDTDFLATARLMGDAGLVGADQQRVFFLIDANTRWKALQLASLKTKDVFENATLERGNLTGVWGYRVFTSYNMHKASAARKANTAGKVDVDTTSNNTTGAILAVRQDFWKLAYKRRMTMETTRRPESDSNEIVVLMRVGLKQRDTTASAITYNVGVA